MFTEENIVTTLHNIEKDQAYLKGTRVPVWLVVNMLGKGISKEQILEQYPAISPAEINAAVKYAGSAAVIVS